MNVIVVVTDTMRKDHLGCYGNEWIKTPNIDKLASQGVVFENAYSENMPTIPARLSMFLGRYTLPYRAWQTLEPEDDHLPELLWATDYRKALITDTYNMHRRKEVFCRGFEYVQFIRGQSADPVGESIVAAETKVDLSKYSTRNWKICHSPGSRYGEPSSEEEVKNAFESYLRRNSYWKSEEDHFVAQVAKAGAAWLRRQVESGRSDHLFLWLDSFDPHEPWDPPENYYKLYDVPTYRGLPILGAPGAVDTWDLDEIRHVRAQYAGKVTLVDNWIGIFLEEIDDLGLTDSTLIIYTSDHGQYLGEKGIMCKCQAWPYEEISHIPFIMRLPDGERGARRVKTHVGLPDIAPTILDFLGVKSPKTHQGKSLLPLARGQVEDDREQVSFSIAGFYGRSRSIRQANSSYYEWVEEHPLKKEPELYRFNQEYTPPKPCNYQREDQAEKQNIIDKEPELARQLELRMLRFLASLHACVGDIMAAQTRIREGFTFDSRRRVRPYAE
ncbi:MAG: sulfatase [Candidatus Bathyarchaeia archaeon]